MPVWGKRAVRFSIFVSISALAIGCSESKVAQCNKLIDVANQAVAEMESVTQSSSPQDVEAMEQIANTADQAKAAMEALSLSDQQLRDYQTRFVTMYGDTSEATRELVAAAGEQNPEAAQQAFDSLQEATNREEPLVTEVNTYCTSTN